MNQKDTLAEKLRLLAELKTQKKELAEKVKENDTELDQAEKDAISILLDMAETSGMDAPTAFTVTLDGRRYGVTTKTYYNIKAADRDVAFAALRELGHGDLITEKVDRRTLNSALAQIAEEHGGELPEEYQEIPMSEYTETKISDRKA